MVVANLGVLRRSQPLLYATRSTNQREHRYVLNVQYGVILINYPLDYFDKTAEARESANTLNIHNAQPLLLDQEWRSTGSSGMYLGKPL